MKARQIEVWLKKGIILSPIFHGENSPVESHLKFAGGWKQFYCEEKPCQISFLQLRTKPFFSPLTTILHKPVYKLLISP